MIALLLVVLGKLTSWLVSLLPVSPFASLESQVPASLDAGLAWLNTFVPVGAIVGVMTAWAAAMLAFVVVVLVRRFTLDKLLATFGIK